MKYSLAYYTLTLKTDDPELNSIFSELSFGGNGSAVGEITASYSNDLWSRSDYATGGYVHEQNLNRSGKITVSVNQLCKHIGKLINLCNAYYGKAETVGLNGLTISLTDGDGKEILSAIDCVPVKIQDQKYSEKSGNQDWEFDCGEITIA